jgi:regulator of sigma E protease
MPGGSILAAILVLALVIFIHELGHFLVAKWCDVEVRCFSMGFGPTVISRTWGETEYRIALIPLGGYVSMAGQDDGFEDEQMAPADPSRGFTAKSVPQRAAIIAAGPAFNFGYAFVVFSLVALFFGMPVPTNVPVVGDLTPGAPAEAAGLLAGDTVLSIEGLATDTWESILPPILEGEGRPVEFLVRGVDGTERSVSVTPEQRDRHDQFGEVTGQRWYIGVGRPMEILTLGVTESIELGFKQTTYYSGMILMTLGRLVQGRLDSEDVGGPILIAQEASRQAESGWAPLFGFMALISINLGIINLLPFPVLDGGHLAFILFEAVRGKPLPLRVRDGALQVGVVVLGALMIFVVFNDIFRIVSG